MVRYTGYDYYEPYIKRYLLMNISKERTLLVCYNSINKEAAEVIW